MPEAARTTHLSLQRAAAILRVFTEQEPSLTVSEIGRRLDLHKSTASRLLAALADEGLVWQNPRTGHYALGLGLVELAGVALGQIDVRAASLPHMERLAASVNETVTVSVLRGREAVTVAHTAPLHSIRYASWIGRRMPLHSTAAGKVFLAALTTKGENSQAKAGTEKTVDPDAGADLATELRIIHRTGVASEIDEFEAGSSAVAARIQDATGAVVAALSIGGPTDRFGSLERARAVPLLLETAGTIAGDLGGRNEVSA